MKPPKYAVLIHIDSIYTLRSGPNAGTRFKGRPLRSAEFHVHG